MTNHDLIELLEAHVKVATMATMTDRTFDVKNMGMAHASSEYKKGK